MKISTSVIAHHIDGQGDTVLLLNGGFMTYGSWQPVAVPLRREYRVLLCDLRGQLRSPGPSHPTLSGNVRDVIELLDSLEIPSVHVMGASFGGFVGLQLAADHSERVRSIVAITTSAIATPSLARGVVELRRAIADILAGGDPWQFQELLIKDVYSPEYLAAHRREFAERREQVTELPRSWFANLDGILNCTESIDLRSTLDRIECPAMVVHAAADQVFPRQRSEALAAVLSAQLVEHPTSGHALVAEDPEWLAEQCLRFLRGLSSGQDSFR